MVESLLFDADEHPVETPLTVEGRLPPWLRGTLLRNGPARFSLPRGDSVRHWFDGLALLHAVHFLQSRVTYVSRFLRSQAYAGMLTTGRPTLREFATDPSRPWLARAAAAFRSDLTDNANVNVISVGLGPLAMTEVAVPRSIDPETLAAGSGRPAWRGYRIARRMTTAHPIPLPDQQGTVLNYGIDFGLRSRYELFTSAYTGAEPQIIARIPVARPSYMHSFSCSGRYVILTEYPYRARPLDLLLSSRPFIENYQWRPKEATRLIVIDRNAPERPRYFETAALFAFHHTAAFERRGKLCVDLIGYPDPSIIQRLYNRETFGAERIQSRLLRLEIEMAGKPAVALIDTGIEEIEFPHVVGRCGEAPRRLYACARHEGGPADAIVRITNAAVDAQWRSEHCMPGEPVFVPAPGDKAGGVVLSIVLDTASNASFLLVLDPRLDEVARLSLPSPVPPGLHGCFIA
jgi:carotenoid cleavage dioxygenase-like enzyme